MTGVHVFRVNLSGWQGGPGMNTWTAIPAQIGSTFMTQAELDVAADGLQSFYEAIRAEVIGGMDISLAPEVRVYDATTGVVAGAMTCAPWQWFGSGANNAESRATQYKLNLHTNFVSEGRRLVRGGIFLGPASSSGLAPDGQIDPIPQNTINNALATLLTTAPWIVWHRPIVKDGVVERDGDVALVSGHSVSSMPGTLRRRKYS